MRKFALVLTGIVLAAISLQAQDKKITGSGNVITKEIAVASFDQLSVQGAFSVLLAQDNKEEVKIEADDNLQELLEVKNEGSKLVISMQKNVNVNSKKTIKVYITFKKLKNMELKTVGSVSSGENLNFDDLKISNRSVGSVNLKLTAKTLDLDNTSVGEVRFSGRAGSATIRNTSVGSISAADLVVEAMDIENKGIGTAEVNATRELKVKDSFLGKVKNKGAAPVKKIRTAEI